jgi:hypothetical protein
MTIKGKPPGMKIGRSLAEEVLRKWIRLGTLPEGFSVRAIHWQRGNGGKGIAKTQDEIDNAVRVLLRRIPLDFQEIRFS